MSASLIAGIFWVFVATATALLPMRYQFPPGIVLLLIAPFLLIWIGYEKGLLIALLCLGAFLSMFRRPLWYLCKKALRKLIGQKREGSNDE